MRLGSDDAWRGALGGSSPGGLASRAERHVHRHPAVASGSPPGAQPASAPARSTASSWERNHAEPGSPSKRGCHATCTSIGGRGPARGAARGRAGLGGGGRAAPGPSRLDRSARAAPGGARSTGARPRSDAPARPRRAHARRWSRGRGAGSRGRARTRRTSRPTDRRAAGGRRARPRGRDRDAATRSRALARPHRGHRRTGRRRLPRAWRRRCPPRASARRGRRPARRSTRARGAEARAPGEVVDHRDDEAPRRRHRIERGAIVHHRFELGDRRAEAPREPPYERRRLHPAARAHQERVVELRAQARERLTHRRLGDAHPARGPRDADLLQERVERHQEVRVDGSQLRGPAAIIRGAHGTSSPNDGRLVGSRPRLSASVIAANVPGSHQALVLIELSVCSHAPWTSQAPLSRRAISNGRSES